MSGTHGDSGAPRTRIMGILNVTPDSFSDGGRFEAVDTAVAQALQMAVAGADIVDIGGESTRPGYEPIDAATERARVLPVIEAVAPRLSIPISVDTRKAEVAAAAIQAGATIVNDIWGLQRDDAIARVAADADADVVAMHNRDEIDATIDIVDDIRRFFDRSIAIARQAGVRDEKLILDPGIGFGKTLEQNLAAVKRLPEIKALGFRVLLGVSRKSSIGRILDKPVDERLIGTVAMNVWAMRDGVDIIRVHDVAEHVDAREIVAAIEGA
ncbi:dihydropteroate synthase [Microbaculum marinisediminis]|uniref:Dihydropteroate synthase n=1 Tax=Microbaculum marinisediminis TaxID=2931392 RepID=A0AAW5QX82_9HYPH|nr:dihydropteroate synthase [Microbaculum sp. A6E488]MCT8972671.1 dihydropteroate synthase [Microbaculum sp. A6E488]